jgi:hypothetical protein
MKGTAKPEPLPSRAQIRTMIRIAEERAARSAS